MQSLYKEVPPALQGYVELVYDLNNNPSFRLLESLLYTSRYYKPSAQELMLSVINGDDRPFVLSTPRLSNPNSIRLAIPFADERVDWLFRLKRCPSQWREICERLQVPENEHTLLRSFFTSQSPAPYKPYDASGARWRYFGHACILVETSDVSILFDPVLSYTYESDISRYTYDDLPEKIDFVVITHNHQDHILFETLLQIRHKVKIFIVPRSGSGEAGGDRRRGSCMSVTDPRVQPGWIDYGAAVFGRAFRSRHPIKAGVSSTTWWKAPSLYG